MIGAITGVLSSRSPNASEFFTSVVYPFETTDSLSIPNVTFSSPGTIWRAPEDAATILLPTILSGTLVSTLVTYNMVTEPLAVDLPAVLSGSLVTTLVTYSMVTEPLDVSLPAIVSGTLATTISYISYNNGVIENLAPEHPTIISGTLI